MCASIYFSGALPPTGTFTSLLSIRRPA
jgi:hypothetical protein